MDNVFNEYEWPSFKLGERVIHKSSGKLCEVRGYYAWNPPIIQYFLLDAETHVPLDTTVTVSELESTGEIAEQKWSPERACWL